MKYIFYITLIIILFYSCANNNIPDLYHSTVNYRLSNHIIKIPESYWELKEFTEKYDQNRKTLFVLFESQHILSISSLLKWKELYSKNKTFQEVNFYFIFLGSKNKFIEEQIRVSEQNFPIIFDENSEFIYLNKLEKYSTEAFLLDMDNKIKCSGNPIDNKYILSYYTTFIKN